MCAPNLMSLRPVVVLKLFFSHSKLKTAISIGAKLEEKTTSGRIDITFCTDVHGSQKMYPRSFYDPLTFPLVPPQGHKLKFFL